MTWKSWPSTWRWQRRSAYVYAGPQQRQPEYCTVWKSFSNVTTGSYRPICTYNLQVLTSEILLHVLVNHKGGFWCTKNCRGREKDPETQNSHFSCWKVRFFGIFCDIYPPSVAIKKWLDFKSSEDEQLQWSFWQRKPQGSWWDEAWAELHWSWDCSKNTSPSCSKDTFVPLCFCQANLHSPVGLLNLRSVPQNTCFLQRRHVMSPSLKPLIGDAKVYFFNTVFHILPKENQATKKKKIPKKKTTQKTTPPKKTNQKTQPTTKPEQLGLSEENIKSEYLTALMRTQISAHYN